MSPRISWALSVLCAVSGFQAAGLLVKRRVPPPAASLQVQEPAVQSPISETPLESALLDALNSVERAGASPVKSLRELSALCEKAGSPGQSRLALMEAIQKMKPEELQALLEAEARGTDLFRASRFDFQFAARRLSEVAPEKAAALWLASRASQYGVDVLLSPWAKRDPQAFASWSKGLPPDAQKALGATMAQMAVDNPDQFAGIASQMAQSAAGAAGARGAISGMMQRAGKGSDPSEAIAYAQALPEGPARVAALAEVARWPGLDLGAHPEVAAALGQISPADARRYVQQVAGAADKLPQGALRDSAYVLQFAKAAQKDVEGAAARMESMAKSADYPAAVRGFVDATAAKDPAAALEWALTISTPGTQRSAALEKAAAEYFRRKPADAIKWVESAPLSAQEYLMLTGRSR